MSDLCAYPPCGKPFDLKRADARFCSNTCRAKNSKANQRGAAADPSVAPGRQTRKPPAERRLPDDPDWPDSVEARIARLEERQNDLDAAVQRQDVELEAWAAVRTAIDRLLAAKLGPGGVATGEGRAPTGLGVRDVPAPSSQTAESARTEASPLQAAETAGSGQALGAAARGSQPLTEDRSGAPAPPEGGAAPSDRPLPLPLPVIRALQKALGPPMIDLAPESLPLLRAKHLEWNGDKEICRVANFWPRSWHPGLWMAPAPGMKKLLWEYLRLVYTDGRKPTDDMWLVPDKVNGFEPCSAEDACRMMKLVLPAETG